MACESFVNTLVGLVLGSENVSQKEAEGKLVILHQDSTMLQDDLFQMLQVKRWVIHGLHD